MTTSSEFTLVLLPEYLERAIFLTKQVLRHRVLHVGATEARLFVKIDGVEHETSSIYLRKEDPEKIEQLRNELLYRFPDDEFDDILLGIRNIKTRMLNCPNCNKEMRSDNLSRHLKTCAKNQYCPVCQKEVQGNLKEHIDCCCRKTYDCSVCGESFNTGARRTAHQKKCSRKTYDCNICSESFTTIAMRDVHIKDKHRKTHSCGLCGESFNRAAKRVAHEKTCRVADEKTINQVSTDSDTQSALGGLFRIVKINPKNNSADYEGVMEDEVVHIAEILNNRMETALKFYISAELDMSRLTDGATKLVYFQTSSTTLLQNMDVEPEVKGHVQRIASKIDKYIKNGSGWSVDRVNAISVMITKFNPL